MSGRVQYWKETTGLEENNSGTVPRSADSSLAPLLGGVFDRVRGTAAWRVRSGHILSVLSVYLNLPLGYCHHSIMQDTVHGYFYVSGAVDAGPQGIVFSVRPPKKSWKNIANLSGGEKTLSSLSLVFALHHYKPTPLYVMDEIDAALGAQPPSHASSKRPSL